MTPLLTSALLRTQSDSRLVDLARAGDERAFEAIVHRYGRALHRHCRTLLPETRCDDVVQQTFVNAWAALQDDVAVRDLRPWLYRIARNLALNALRGAGAGDAELHETLLRSVPSPAEAVERREDVRATLAGVAGLPERQRDALVAVAVQGRTHDDVAAELGMSDGALRQLLHRARTSLRAAAAAVVPLPLVHRLCGGGQGLTAARAGEIAAGAGGAGVAGFAVKGMAAVVAAATVAGGAAGGVHLARGGDAGRGAAPAAPAAKAPAAPVAATDPGATRVAVVAPVRAAHRSSSSSAPAAARRARRVRHVPRASTPVPAAAPAPTRKASVETEDRRGPSRHQEDEHEDAGQASHSGSSGSSESSGHDASEQPEHTDAPEPAEAPETTTEAPETPSGSGEAEDRSVPVDDGGSDGS